MITLARVGDVVRFTFQDNPLYLNNGTIEVPVNSLSLLIDESNIATFKKATSNDIFLSCSLNELGMTRTQLINWYKDNMVDEGITPEEVEDIVESATTNLFGYAEYDSQNTRIIFKHDASGSVISSIDASDFVIDGMIDNVEIVTVEGVKYLKITFNTESGKEPILIPLADIFNPDNYYTKTATDALLAAKADTATTYTKTEVDNAISAATSGKADADDVYTKTEVDNAISAATSGKVDTTVFDEKERAVSIALNDLEDRKLDASAYTPTDLSNYYTKSETDGEIEEAVSGKADTSAVTEVNNALTAHTANTDIHVTSTDKTNWNSKPNTVSLTQAAYDSLAEIDPNCFYVITDAEGVDLDNYYTKTEVDSTLSGKADTSAVTQAISAATSGKADSDSVYTKTEVDSVLSGKQDTLIAGTNITISGNVISAEGGGSSYTAGDGIDITNDVISVTGKADTSAVTEAISAATSGKADSDSVYTKTETDSALSGKQDTLVSGTNIKTINNTSILGSGNIDIQGGGVNVVQTTGTSTTDVMSQDAVTTQLNDTVKLSNVGTYFISTFNNYTGSLETVFHRFDANSLVYGARIWYGKINDKYTCGYGNSAPSDLMNLSVVETSAITTSMTSSSTDSQVPSAKAVYDNFGGLKLVKLTQAEYDALVTKDSDTLYVVTDN